MKHSVMRKREWRPPRETANRIALILALAARSLSAPAQTNCSLAVSATLTGQSGQVELRWESCTNYDYQVEKTGDFQAWNFAGPPYAAPAGGGWLTNVLTATNPYTFYRVRTRTLTNSPVPAAPGNYDNLFMTADGLRRSYRLMLPTNYNPAVSNAFAFILHGHNQTADSFVNLHPGLLVSALTNNLILALPNGVADERGTGWSNRDPEPGEYQVNDVSFLLALLDRLDATLTLDRRRIYSGGFSAGGVMSYYLSSRTTNVLAAIAAVESAIGGSRDTNAPIVTNPPPSGPLSAFILNCTNSCGRPYYGGLSDAGSLMTPAIAAAYFWTNANLCTAAMTATTNTFVSSNINRFSACGYKPPASEPQTNQVIIQRWLTCTGATEVFFVTLTDGGHIWPDGNDNLGFDANREVLRFFLQHQRP